MLAVLACALPAALASADSFTPVRLGIAVTPVARLHKPLAITVHVSADAGALDSHSGPVRIQVKLAQECGGSYQYTPGVVLLDQQLSPQPATGRAYSAVAHGSGRPASYGAQTVCAFLDDNYEKLADDTTYAPQVTVSKACTVAAARYDAARRARNARRNKSKVAAARRAARRACGPGVTL
jgi:hypothetical protein